MKFSDFFSLSEQNWDGFWLSANDIGQTAGRFVWSDESMVDSTMWDKANGQPSHFAAGKQTCVYLRTSNAKLHDYTCLIDHRYIMCEIPAALFYCLQ